MKISLLSSILFFAILFSCRKPDKLASINLPESLLDSVILTDYPGKSFTINYDSLPFVISNSINLPNKVILQNINLKLFVRNTTRVEVDEIEKDGLIYIKNYVPEIGTNQINLQIDYFKTITIKLFNIDFPSIFTLKLNQNQLPDPIIANLSFNLNPHNLTPLAGILHVSVDQPVTVEYSVKGQDGEDFTNRANSDNNGYINMNLYGLYPNSKNLVKVMITNKEGSNTSQDFTIQTGTLPPAFPDSTDIVVKQLDKANAKTGFILYYPYKTINTQFNSPGNMSYPIVLDKFGKVRWYMTDPFVLDMKPMPNGHFLQYYYNWVFREVDLMGNVYKEVYPPIKCHHDFQLLPNGNILYAGEDVSVNQTEEDKIYELDFQTGSIVKTINLFTILDPTRQQQPFIAGHSGDWFHNNSLAYDPIDNSLLISGRHQSTICKIDYATNELKWIISDPTNWKAPLTNYLLQPEGSDFEYSWGQHSIVINPNDHNKLIVFDNGNARSYTNPATPVNSYSRLVEFSINSNNKTVTQTFDFGKSYGSENFSPALGNVDYIDQNLFVCFPLIVKDVNGNASTSGAPSIRFMETDRNRNVVLDISIKNRNSKTNGYRTYRGHPFKFN